MSKSLIEYAYDYLSKSKKKISTFQDMWAYVVKESGMNEDEAKKRVGQFFSNLLLDGRFIALDNNMWDLRVNQKFDESRTVNYDDESEVDLDKEETEGEENLEETSKSDDEFENDSEEKETQEDNNF